MDEAEAQILAYVQQHGDDDGRLPVAHLERMLQQIPCIYNVLDDNSKLALASYCQQIQQQQQQADGSHSLLLLSYNDIQALVNDLLQPAGENNSGTFESWMAEPQPQMLASGLMAEASLGNEDGDGSFVIADQPSALSQNASAMDMERLLMPATPWNGDVSATASGLDPSPTPTAQGQHDHFFESPMHVAGNETASFHFFAAQNAKTVRRQGSQGSIQQEEFMSPLASSSMLGERNPFAATQSPNDPTVFSSGLIAPSGVPARHMFETPLKQSSSSSSLILEAFGEATTKTSSPPAPVSSHARLKDHCILLLIDFAQTRKYR
jgi:hypothetical protein